jgi:hypothetical protein
MEKKVLTEEEMSNLTNLRNRFQTLTQSIGNTEVQILSLNIQKETYADELKSIKKQELNLAQELEEKYGQGTVSLETGEFLPK